MHRMATESGPQSGMKAISLLTLVAAIGLLSLGAMAVLRRNEASFLHSIAGDGADLTSSAAVGLGIVMLILGALILALAIALFRGNTVAKVIVAVFMLGNLATGVWTLVKFNGIERVSGIGQIVLSVLVLVVLARSRAARSA